MAPAQPPASTAIRGRPGRASAPPSEPPRSAAAAPSRRRPGRSSGSPAEAAADGGRRPATPAGRRVDDALAVAAVQPGRRDARACTLIRTVPGQLAGHASRRSTHGRASIRAATAPVSTRSMRSPAATPAASRDLVGCGAVDARDRDLVDVEERRQHDAGRGAGDGDGTEHAREPAQSATAGLALDRDATVPDARVDGHRAAAGAAADAVRVTPATRRCGAARAGRARLRRSSSDVGLLAAAIASVKPTMRSSGSSVHTGRGRDTRAAPRTRAARTSSAVAPGSAWKKLACFGETDGPADAQALAARRVDEAPGRVAGRVAEHRAGVGAAGLVLAPPADDLGDARLARVRRVVGAPRSSAPDHDLASASTFECAVAELELGRRRGSSSCASGPRTRSSTRRACAARRASRARARPRSCAPRRRPSRGSRRRTRGR